MFDFIFNIYDFYLKLITNYPVFAGILSVWGLTVITYSFKYIPDIYYFFKRQFFTSLEFNNAGWSGNEKYFLQFLNWYLKTPYAKWSRSLSLDASWSTSTNSYDPVIGAGYGTHFFFFKNRLFWFEKTSLASQGSDKEKQSIQITTYGRNHKPIIDLINSFTVVPPNNTLCIYTPNVKDGDWTEMSRINKRNLNSVILKKEIKTSLLNNLDYFFNNREWYESRGLAYKQCYILHGKPGTGKTSTIKALASHYDKNVCTIDLSSVSNTSFEKLMSKIPQNSIVLIEDFDSVKALHSRENDSNQILIEEPLTLSKVLNVLDGIVDLNGVVIFFTTNYLEKIDSALIRKGRVDYIYEIEYMGSDEIKEYIKLMYPDFIIPNDVNFKSIAGCELQSLFLECKSDSEKFYNNLETI